MTPEALSAAVADISIALVEARAVREPFQLRNLCRTCETMLAGLGVSSDIRAQLQSHGLGGVQNRHYDRHDYAPEKAHTLALWAAHMKGVKEGNGQQSNVVRLVRPSIA